MILLHVWSHISQQDWEHVSSQSCKSLKPCKSPCGNRWIPASTGNTIPEQKEHSWDQNNPRLSNAHASRRGGQLSICRLDHSASPFKNAAFLSEEIFPVSFSHHCYPGIIRQREGATFLEQSLFACQWQTGSKNTACAMGFRTNRGVCSVTHRPGSSASYAADLVHTNNPKTSHKAEMLSLLAKEMTAKRGLTTLSFCSKGGWIINLFLNKKTRLLHCGCSRNSEHLQKILVQFHDSVFTINIILENHADITHLHSYSISLIFML